MTAAPRLVVFVLPNALEVLPRQSFQCLVHRPTAPQSFMASYTSKCLRGPIHEWSCGWRFRSEGSQALDMEWAVVITSSYPAYLCTTLTHEIGGRCIEEQFGGRE
jgi:hypothetical protein